MADEPHILLVDDEREIREPLASYLTRNGVRVTKAENAAVARQMLSAYAIDLVLLDIMMPGEDGLALTGHIRATSQIPVILLTAKTEETDRIVGLEIGADDYVTKPFSPRELLARIRALLRRVRAQASVADAISAVRAYRFGGWELNIGLRKLKNPAGQPVDITKGEFSLLTAFLSAPQRILARDQLLDLSRLHNAEVYDRSIDIQILRLRRKIEADPAQPQFIKTERGVGYIFSVPVTVVR